MEVRIDRLDVVQSDRSAEQLPVERQREAAVDVVTVEDRRADDAPDKPEVGQMILRTRTLTTPT